MMNKIAFLCVNPCERFLPFSFQSCGREYYRRVKEQAISRKWEVGCREYVDIYGEAICKPETPWFSNEEDRLQFLYIQSGRLCVLEEVLQEADLVITGFSGSRREMEKLYLTVYPWREKVLFLWDSHICRDEDFAERIVKDFKLRKAQVMEVRKGM